MNAAFPTITADFDLPVSSIRWVIIVYVLAYASLPLAFGRIADLFGHRRVFVAGLAWCTVALAMCAAAAEFGWLLAARVGQGVGTALLLSSAPALVTLTLPPEQRTRGIAVYTLCFAVSATIGPLLGGALVQAFGWPAVFWMRIPIAVVALALVLRTVPVPPPRAAGIRFDPLSGATLAFGLAATLLALAQGGHFGWSSPVTLALGVAGITLLAVFARRQREPAHRVMDFTLFRDPGFAAVNACHLLLNAANFVIMLLVPFYLARAHGPAGVMLLTAAPLGFALGSPLAERLLRDHGARRVIGAALAVSTVFLVLIALWPERAHAAWIAATLLGAGVGYGVFQVAVLDQVMGTLSRADQGVAGSLNTVTRTVGVVAGTSAGAAAFDALHATHGFMGAFAGVFGGAAVMSAAATVLLLAVRPARRGVRQR